jgi:hypothetical protein
MRCVPSTLQPGTVPYGRWRSRVARTVGWGRATLPSRRFSLARSYPDRGGEHAARGPAPLPHRHLRGVRGRHRRAILTAHFTWLRSWPRRRSAQRPDSLALVSKEMTMVSVPPILLQVRIVLAVLFFVPAADNRNSPAAGMVREADGARCGSCRGVAALLSFSSYDTRLLSGKPPVTAQCRGDAAVMKDLRADSEGPAMRQLRKLVAVVEWG